MHIETSKKSDTCDIVKGMDVRHYGGVIWTNHALERLGHRGLNQQMAHEAFKNPDKKNPGKQSGTMQFEKKFGNSTVTIIAKQNEKYEWLILSCWIDPPIVGYMDYYKKKRYVEYGKAGFWGKFWITFKEQLGF